MHNSGLRLLYKFLLCIVVGTMLYGMHILSEILTIETDEGFQYQVELYLKQKQRGTFKQRFFIGCGLPERNGFINMVTRQGTLRLKIPVGDGVSEIYRLNDMKDECSPDQFRVRLFWYQGQLVNAKEFNRLKELPGAPQGNPNYRTVYLSFINLHLEKPSTMKHIVTNPVTNTIICLWIFFRIITKETVIYMTFLMPYMAAAACVQGCL